MDFVNSACARAAVPGPADPAVAGAIRNQFTKISETLNTGTGTGFGA